jgi:hypothetical protein
LVCVKMNFVQLMSFLITFQPIPEKYVIKFRLFKEWHN